MNAPAVDRVLDGMRRGKRVLVLSPREELAIEAFRTCASRLEEDEKTSRVAGRYTLTNPVGGVVRFLTAGSSKSLRGAEADLVVLDGVHPQSDLEIEHFLINVQARGGGVVRA